MASNIHHNLEKHSNRSVDVKAWALIVTTADQALLFFNVHAFSFLKHFINSCGRLILDSVFCAIEMASAVTDYCRTLVSVHFFK